MVKGRNKVKLRTFIKTYLYLNGKSTANQLADAYNKVGLSRHDITKQTVANFLRIEMSLETTILKNLDFTLENNVRYYYLRGA